MRVGIITSPKMLKYSTTDIHYCLPRFIVEDLRYRKFFQSKLDKGDAVITDLVEPGWKRKPERLLVIEEALQYLTPTHIILPSLMFDSKKTTELIEKFGSLLDGVRAPKIACVEGADFGAIAGMLTALRHCRIIAYPSHLYRLHTPIIERDKGQSVIYIDNYRCVDELSGIKEGILVTSLPIRLGLAGRFLSDYSPAPPHLKFDEEEKFPAIIRKNVQEVIEHYGD